MKLVTYERAGETRVGLVQGGRVVDAADLGAAATDMIALLRDGL